MKRAILFIFSVLTLSSIIFSLNLILPRPILAAQGDPCCTKADCSGGGGCGGANCPISQGSCTSGFEGCGSGSPGGGGCSSGLCCDSASNLCVVCGGGGCFPAGTKITLPGNKTANIENVKVGDRVVSEDTNGNKSISTVQALERPTSTNMCVIRFTNGDTLKVTKGHPLFTPNAWKAIDVAEAYKEDPGVPVTTLTVGDFMKKDTRAWDQISNISCQNISSQTYNFTVDTNHDYFAGGFLAHNKAGCFPAGTKVQMGNGTQKNIEDVKVGDKVLSEDGNGNKSIGTVQALERPLSDNLCKIKYTDNDSLDVTNSHPLFTPTGWKAINPEAALSENPGVPVTRLLPDDFMKKSDGTWSQISSIGCKPENNLQVYNFTVDGNHDYFAGGFLAHNKGVCGGCKVPSQDPVHGLDPVTSFSVTQTSLTSALITWSGPGGTCSGRGEVDIFIGRNKNAVQANCGYNGGDGVGAPNAPDIDVIVPQGGADGGGNGGTPYGAPPTNGTPNTGGGGGGGGQGTSGANGGNGIVIVRFRTGSINVTTTGGACVPIGTDTMCKFGSATGSLIVNGGTTTAQLLVVGGGGAGGQTGGGGGGGGAVRYAPNFPLSPGTYAISVGAGGIFSPPSGRCDPNARGCGWQWLDFGGGHNGGSTSFGNITAIGGGGAGSAGRGCQPGNNNRCLNYSVDGKNGGSGGGGAMPDGYFKSIGGAGVANQGSNGGNVPSSVNLGGAGGGGATAVGTDGQNRNTGGAGGNGRCLDISGQTVCYGAGGAGGSVWIPVPPGCTWARRVNTDVYSLNTATNGITLAPNTVYYVKVNAHYLDPKGGGNFCGAVPAHGYCTTTLSPSVANVNVGDPPVQFKTILNDIHPYTTNVVYSASPTYIKINPGSSTVNPFITNVSGVQKTPVTGAKMQTSVYLQPGDPAPACSDVATVNVAGAANAKAWWQVKDSDVASIANTDINSLVPASLLFDLDGGGKFPGVVAYGGATNLTTTDVSSQKWLAQSALANPKAYGYDFFANQIPSSVTVNTINPGDDLAADLANPAAAVDPNGYHWFKYSSKTTDLTLANPLTVGAKKIILFVDAPNFNVNNTINGVTKGSGFFMVIVKGNISVNNTIGGVAPQVNPNLEGIYVADGKFTDGTKTPANDTQLFLRGSIAIYGGVTLQRDLGGSPNSTDPAELFQYAPDQVMLFPKALSTRKINWKEVAP